jgi:hypothetical protein
VIVNNPPYVIPSPEITRNDDFFPYSTQIRLTAYDVEGDALSFLYYNTGGRPWAAASRPTSARSRAPGTVRPRATPASRTSLTAPSPADSRIVLKIVDSQSGTRLVNFDFFGRRRPRRSSA